MKKTNTLKIFLVLGILFCYVNTMNAQIRLVEVNPTTDTVKVHNYGGITVDILIKLKNQTKRFVKR